MAVGSLNYTPSKTIREFMLSEHKMRALMGPVGGGKTTGGYCGTAAPSYPNAARRRWFS